MNKNASRHRALFLDRDGTLMYDTGYPNKPEQVELVPGVCETLRTAQELGFALIMVSNQSGIGRGLITPDEAVQVQSRLEELLAQNGVALDAVYCCPHAPPDRCGCRKPSPQMVLHANADLGVIPADSLMIGDKITDIQAGKAAGCQTVFFDLHGTGNADSGADYNCRSWAEILHVIRTASSLPDSYLQCHEA
jgi:histidinol-phosphate phosphatase family protein